MMVMPADNNKGYVHYLAGKYPGLLGHLYGPGRFRNPYTWLPYALDNGAFPAFTNATAWDADAFMALVERAAASGQAPLWVVVPDVVGDKQATLRLWDEWAPRLERFGWPLAFAVQDGMTTADVPSGAAVVFVGGTTKWKRRTIHEWCARFKRVHVGRINTERWLWYCWRAGAESCDGTGWFRGNQDQVEGLANYLRRSGSGAGPCPKIETRDLFGGFHYAKRRAPAPGGGKGGRA